MKKMMFNDPYNLTQAVLNGTKTMTRRVLKGNVSLGNWEETAKKLSYKVGEVVAVAQSYREVLECVPAYNDTLLDDRGSLYKEYKAGYNNKLFVKSKLMPYHIRITDIKIERLQDISKEDCLKEGITFIESLSIIGYDAYFFTVKPKARQIYGNILKFFPSPQRAYADLIDKISGRGTWKRNPWVVVYTFERAD